MLSGEAVPGELEEAWGVYSLITSGMAAPFTPDQLNALPHRLVREMQFIGATLAEIRAAKAEKPVA